jgi:iron(III) transport system substrate-binding protein
VCLGVTLAVVALCAACRIEVGAPARAADSEAATVRVYSSIYQHVIDALQPALLAELRARGHGNVQVEWFQSGSEKVAARLDAELASGGSPCDLLLTSDPSYFDRLKRDSVLVAYVSPATLKMPRELIDPDGAWALSRIVTMAIAVSPKLDAQRVPKSFADLSRGTLKVALGDPLASGTSLTAVASLATHYGWDYFRALKRAGAVVAGGNAAVLQRVESGESDAGVVLLENILAARARGSKVIAVIPEDGAVVIPGPIALLKHGARSLAARAVYDAFLSDKVQQLMVQSGRMHSPDLHLAPPEGAPPLRELLARAQPQPTEPTEKVKAAFNAIFFQ